MIISILEVRKLEPREIRRISNFLTQTVSHSDDKLWRTKF